MLDDIEQLRIEKELKQQEGYGMKDFYNQKFSRKNLSVTIDPELKKKSDL